MCMWMCTQMRASVGSSCAKDYEGDREVQTMLGQEKLPQVEKELNMCQNQEQTLSRVEGAFCAKVLEWQGNRTLGQD